MKDDLLSAAPVRYASILRFSAGHAVTGFLRPASSVKSAAAVVEHRSRVAGRGRLSQVVGLMTAERLATAIMSDGAVLPPVKAAVGRQTTRARSRTLAPWR